jgi:acyl-CoA synthetase (AMP-forming)/AMP-acid ligase II
VTDPETGLTVPRGKPGEPCTRGYSVMLGYWEEPGKTAEAIDAARWMHTGDLAVMDADGYVNITGRIKDMVIRGGENVYPREIEEFLYTHPDVLDAQVIGVPDARYGKELMAWIRLRPGADPLTAESLREYPRLRPQAGPPVPPGVRRLARYALVTSIRYSLGELAARLGRAARAAAWPGRRVQHRQPSPAAGARPAAARQRPHAAARGSPRP